MIDAFKYISVLNVRLLTTIMLGHISFLSKHNKEPNVTTNKPLVAPSQAHYKWVATSFTYLSLGLNIRPFTRTHLEFCNFFL
jgi:hypothetical protein